MKGDRSGDDVADSASRDARILLQIIARPTDSWVEGYTHLLGGPRGEHGREDENSGRLYRLDFNPQVEILLDGV